ncbi:hypothetical protein BY996DRAFT_6410426 [Phakopsora pachyrhizi]|nr:hypothetical protein BY996DRAFT_6410426 [Phakopsora pachyrhizi]
MSPNEIRAPYRNFWLSISYAPGFFGFWWSGFSALYVCLLSPNRSISQSSKKHPYVPHPLAMNFACLGTPVLVSLMSIAWGVVSVVRYNNREEAHKSLYTILEGLSGSWESQKVVPGSLNSTIEGLERPLQRVMDSNEAFLSQFKWASFSWFIVAIMAVGLFRNSINFSSNAVLSASKIENGPSAHSVEQPALFPSVNSNDRTGTEPWRDDFLPKRKNPMSQKLQESYYFLTWHCGLLSLTLTWYCIVGVIFFAKARELAINPVWRSVAAWIVVSSSTILSLALLLQGRRILEGEVVVDELKNSPAHGVRITTSSAIQQAFEPDIVTFDAHKTKQSHLSVSVHAAQLMQLKFNEPKEQILPHLL